MPRLHLHLLIVEQHIRLLLLLLLLVGHLLLLHHHLLLSALVDFAGVSMLLLLRLAGSLQLPLLHLLCHLHIFSL